MRLEEKIEAWEADYRRKSTKFKKRSDIVSVLRVIVFLVGIYLLYLSFDLGSNLYGLFSLLFIVFGFGTLIRIHNKVLFKKRINQALADLNREELANYSKQEYNSFDDGVRFADANHPYAADLDLFGRHSLFQMINRFTLEGAAQRLSIWLKKSENKDTIVLRQEAIKELAEKMEWTQYLIALSKLSDHKEKEENSFKTLCLWVQEENTAKTGLLLNLGRFLLPASVMLIILFSELGLINYQPYMSIVILLNIIILGSVFKEMMRLGREISGALHIIQAYALLFDHVEKQAFNSSYLQSLHATLKKSDSAASIGVKGLAKLVNRFDSRSNVFFVLINIVFLIDLHTLFSVKKWLSHYRHHLPEWLETMHSISALASIASYYHINPESTFPKISKESHHLDIKGMAHPLLPCQTRVKNDFRLSGKGQIYLITGSNMSGKSTFLRTLGVNIVLAQMGAPVCADTFQWSLTHVFTGMRSHDDLSESISSFYAELKRIKELLSSISDQYPTFFMLDEILKGTNSEDRHKGAEALIRQLHSLNAYGLVSTHDLQLSRLENETSYLKNFSFNSNISEDEIHFDYTLTKGPCKSFNASFLMKKMGIELT